MNETPEDSMSQLGGTADAELRAQILRYSLENTHPQHHKHIRRLCTDWKEYNTRFFGGALIPAVILLNGPRRRRSATGTARPNPASVVVRRSVFGPPS